MKPHNYQWCFIQTVSFVLLSASAVQQLRAVHANALLSRVDYRGNETDYMALLAIKSQLIDLHSNDGVLRYWNNSIHHCHWEGVACGRKHNRVIMLDLHGRDVGGSISPFIGNLSFLSYIGLSNNSLSGPIPHEIGRLWRLQGLYLYNNSLSGEIPTNISGCINLQNLTLSINHLQGELPMGLGALSNLKRLWIDSNYKLAGPVFKVIVNLTSLEFIGASENAFTGTIPNSIFKMTNLTWLNLHSNKLSGIIPSSIYNLSTLQLLDLGDNQLRGSIPPYIAFTLPQLQVLQVYNNQLTGPFPISIQNLTTLQSIGLNSNNFTGNVSINFGNLHSLQQLNLQHNKFEGDITSIITTLLNCTNLKLLDLNDNCFTGVLPKGIANLSTSLTWLSIGGNYSIRGEIPIGITNLVNLITLQIIKSQITGYIPQQLSKLQKLEVLNLNSNRLTGEIPYSFGNLSRLSKLHLNKNHLQGRIPPILGSCENLILLSLDFNNFSGPLPKKLFVGSAKFIELSMSYNQLQGSLPTEIKDQTQLEEFYAYSNQLSGEIPQGLGSLLDLQNLYLGDNFFQGQIPPSLASLKSLAYFDLSQNNISGALPHYFSSFPFLTYLNLSYNNFEGKVPTKGVYANAGAISLDGNTKLCGGIPELHLPRCMEKKRKKRIISDAVKLAISITCPFLGILTIATCIWLYLEGHRRKRRAALSRSLVKEPILKVSYNMLLKATDGFSQENLLGSGAFGSVYKGTLDGITIAVKVLNLEHRRGSKSFVAECEALRNIRHRNLVGIITACSSIDFQGNDFKALVFEFMPNGNLHSWLHQDGSLSLLQRVDIAIDVAHALNYIHHECENPIVHCDLKPSNILLDHDMVAHVADFGLAKVLDQPVHPNQSSSIGVRGTIGYAAPEYGMGGELSLKADLYSFGILLLELITRKRPTDDMFNEDLNLHNYAKTALPDQVLQIADSSVVTEDENEEVDSRVPRFQERLQRREKCIASVIRIGVACSSQLPSDRMKMSEVISQLLKARNIIHNNPRPRHNFLTGARG